jgi:hypothetical protein
MDTIHDQIMQAIEEENTENQQQDTTETDSHSSEVSGESGELATQEPDATEDDTQEGAEALESESDDGEIEQETKPTDTPSDFVEIAHKDGTTERVSVDQLREGYLRQSDYSRNMNAFSEEKKAFEAQAEQVRQQQVAVLNGLQQRFQQLDPISILTGQLQQAVAIGDIEEANRLRLDISDVREQMRAVDSALQYERRKDEEANQMSRQEHLTKHREELFAKMPFIKESGGSQKFQDSVSYAMQKVGISPEEVGDKPDHRNAMLAYYAGLYLKTQEAKPQIAQAIRGKVVSPKPQARQDQAARSKAQLEAAFDKEPSLENFAKLF